MEVTEKDLAERYTAMSSEELVDIARLGQLTDFAHATMRKVLKERGVNLDEALLLAVKRESEPIVLDWMRVSKPFPPVWIGYIIIAAIFVGLTYLVLQNPDYERRGHNSVAAFAFVGWLIGFAYWLFCVYRIHWILAEATNGRYPISPGKAAGFHFIPFFNFVWVFKWPAAMGALLKANGANTFIGGWLGIPILLGTLVAKVFDNTIGLLVLFLTMTYVVSALKRVRSEKIKIQG